MKKQIFGWSMYDFADTIFSALFVTVYFPLFVVLKGGNAFHVGLTMSISMLLAGLLVPFLGAVADQTQRKKLLLFIFTVLCCIFTFFVGFFGLIAVLILGLLANLFYHASLDMYDALLVNISTKRNVGFISGIGTAVGYLGTVFSVVIAYFIGSIFGFESVKGITIIFMLVALFYFGFSLFTFFLIKENVKVKIKKNHFKKAFVSVISTLKNIRKFKNVWLFLLSSFLYVDAASTAIIFLFLYARDQLGFTIPQFLPLYVFMALAGFVGSLIFGKITDRIGHKRSLMIVLSSWVLIILLLYFKTTYKTFIIVGLLGGALLGAVWTITRPMLIQLAPRQKIAELLGYQGLTEKLSGVIGPALFGFIAVKLGFQQALLIIITLFLLGGVVLSFVKDEKK